MRAKLIIASLIVVGAIAYLTFAGASKGGWVYFVDVDKFATDTQLHTRRVRLHGKVDADGFTASAGRMTAQFNLLGKTEKLPVSYSGAIPDMFQAGRDVVVEGRVGASGRFEADVLMTKCASKYEPGSPHGKAGPGTEQRS
jgi:cytochrome c-type biogenesis protein CcmE